MLSQRNPTNDPAQTQSRYRRPHHRATDQTRPNLLDPNAKPILVAHHLVQLSKRHTQLRAELREMQGIVDEQDRVLGVQRMLLSRIRGYACPCERGRR